MNKQKKRAKLSRMRSKFKDLKFKNFRKGNPAGGEEE